MRKVRKKDLYIFLIGVFAFLGIGYAFLTTDLSINGTATMVSNSWDIHFDHLVVQNGSVEIGSSDTAASITSPTTISFAVTLAQPGDYYEFLVDIVNDGTLPGVISSIDIEPFDVLDSKIFGYSYLYDSGRDVKPGDIIDPSSSKTTDFKVFYKTDIDESDLPDNDVQQTITVTITFEQSDHVEKKNCTYNGELVQGAEFVEGPYTYRYMQDNNITYTWRDIEDDGWGFRLTDKDSTDPITAQTCGSINGKPVISGRYAFAGSKATSIDLTKLYTRDMVNMMGMFRKTSFDRFDSSLLYTHNATNMWGMFAYADFGEYDFSHLDTSNVKNMTYMFAYFNTDSLDLTPFNTSNVENMQQMFYGAHIDYLNLSNMGGDKLTNMNQMFREFQGSINFTGFNTSHVIDMGMLFYDSVIDSLDLSSFNTINVEQMSGMFVNSTISVLDISSFDTRNVLTMNMFESNPNLTTIYGANFDTSKVQDGTRITFWQVPNLVGGSGTDCSGILNMTYARIDNPPDAPGCFTAKP